MRKVQKLLTGVFLGGILICGIGTGIALVEYSSLSYGGEKRIGEENLVTEELDYVFDPEKEQINILGNYWTKSIELDESIPKGTVRYEVTYNEKLVEPNLCFWEASADEREDWAPLWQGQEENQEEENDVGRESGSNEEPADDRPPVIRQTCLKFALDNLSDDFVLLMEYKDDILTALKQKQVYNYDVLYITDVKIKINPETMPYVRSSSVRYSLCH